MLLHFSLFVSEENAKEVEQPEDFYLTKLRLFDRLVLFFADGLADKVLVHRRDLYLQRISNQ